MESCKTLSFVLIACFSRKVLNQTGTGHFSPIGKVGWRKCEVLHSISVSALCLCYRRLLPKGRQCPCAGNSQVQISAILGATAAVMEGNEHLRYM